MRLLPLSPPKWTAMSLLRHTAETVVQAVLLPKQEKTEGAMKTCRYCGGVLDLGRDNEDSHSNTQRCVTRLRAILHDVRRDLKSDTGKVTDEVAVEVDRVLGTGPVRGVA